MFFFVVEFFFYIVSQSMDILILSTDVYLHLVRREEQRRSVLSEWLAQQGTRIGHMRLRQTVKHIKYKTCTVAPTPSIISLYL